MNKVNIEIIRNLEMLCFLKIENIYKFKNIILEKLDTNKNYNSFVSYVKRYFFKFHPNIYNYKKLIIHSKEKNMIFI